MDPDRTTVGLMAAEFMPTGMVLPTVSSLNRSKPKCPTSPMVHPTRLWLENFFPVPTRPRRVDLENILSIYFLPEMRHSTRWSIKVLPRLPNWMPSGLQPGIALWAFFRPTDLCPCGMHPLSLLLIPLLRPTGAGQALGAVAAQADRTIGDRV